MKKITIPLLALLILAVVSVSSFNLRARQDLILEQCTLSCFSVIDEVLPGDLIGRKSVFEGYKFSYELGENNVQNCCSQNRTFNGYRIPDFQEVTVLDIDEIDIHVDISPAVKDEKQTSDYLITILHKFERRAFNLSIPENKLSANLTKTTKLKVDFENCDTLKSPWEIEYNLLGDNVYTSLILGVNQNITVEFYTNSTSYTPQLVADIYFSYLQQHQLRDVIDAFPDCELKVHWTSRMGGQSLLYYPNWPSYVASLNISDYVFSKGSISDNSPPKFTSMDSYLLFDQMDATSRQCALNEWQFKFHKEIPTEMREIA